MHISNQVHPSLQSGDITFLGILQSDWLKTYQDYMITLTEMPNQFAGSLNFSKQAKNQSLHFCWRYC